jgi:hypothetical protein
MSSTEVIRLPYSVDTLNGMFAVQLHCAAQREATEVIKYVRVDQRSFIATQRYTVGEWVHDASAEAGTAQYSHDAALDYVLIPQAAALWLSKQLPKALGYTVDQLQPRRVEDREAGAWIIFAADSITIRWGEVILATTRFNTCGGNFPPVARLFPAESPTDPGAPTVSLKPAFIELFTKGAARYLEREAAIRFSFTRTDNPNKPGPVMIESIGLERGSFRGLLQPNLLLR